MGRLRRATRKAYLGARADERNRVAVHGAGHGPDVGLARGRVFVDLAELSAIMFGARA